MVRFYRGCLSSRRCAALGRCDFLQSRTRRVTMTRHSRGWAHEGASIPVQNVELLGSSEKVTWAQGRMRWRYSYPQKRAVSLRMC